MTCPCKSNQPYQSCCQPVHQHSESATRPEQLMRARYSAYALGNVPFIIETYHSRCRAAAEETQISETAKLTWVNLQIIDAPPVQQDIGYVEFIAHYIDDATLFTLQERSRFLRENNAWRYIDGTHDTAHKPLNLSRNSPCPCKSGKKFKRCCDQ